MAYSSKVIDHYTNPRNVGSFAKGEAVVVPASVPQYTVRPQWELEIMRMSLPTGAVAEPRTTLG